ncbi:hypothetical protein [Candidatus Uabimicrobium sp. HlEnr_7]|uniref:hypothetical protein n=1 Tax=Candidatus Uabimicrobium helgolandensis TaxID=3095367 RepID=UPI003556D14C
MSYQTPKNFVTETNQVTNTMYHVHVQGGLNPSENKEEDGGSTRAPGPPHHHPKHFSFLDESYQKSAYYFPFESRVSSLAERITMREGSCVF